MRSIGKRNADILNEIVDSKAALVGEFTPDLEAVIIACGIVYGDLHGDLDLDPIVG